VTKIASVARDRKSESSPRRRGGEQDRKAGLYDRILQRRRGLLYPCKPKAGLHGAQAAVHSSSYRNNNAEKTATIGHMQGCLYKNHKAQELKITTPQDALIG
jgi:hypothetical protein